MNKEDLNFEVGTLRKARQELQLQLVDINNEISALHRKYVEEYPHLLKIGSKVRIKSSWKDYRGVNYENEIIAFIGGNKYSEYFDFRYSRIYPDVNVVAKLLKVKKDGTPRERCEQLVGNVVEIEILEQ